MGKRGPGADRLKKAAAGAVAVAHPWDKDGMPDDERVLAFLRTLPIVSGLKAGELLELLEFQERFVRGVYGDRKVRLAALSLARGNGKSALLAGLGLSHLLGPMQEPYGEVYAAALDREQAGVLYRMTVAYIEATPWMAARVNIKDWHKQIEDEESRSIWRALTSDARKAHGLAPSFWVADEVAQWKSRGNCGTISPPAWASAPGRWA
jgi:phage terminase large subunit-like protein